VHAYCQAHADLGIARPDPDHQCRRQGRSAAAKLAEFGTKRSENNCLRFNANLKAIGGIEADYDGEKISFDAAVQTLKQSRLQGLVYTSPSHTDAKPRAFCVRPRASSSQSSARR
jgi:hypothetical protein